MRVFFNFIYHVRKSSDHCFAQVNLRHKRRVDLFGHSEIDHLEILIIFDHYVWAFEITLIEMNKTDSSCLTIKRLKWFIYRWIMFFECIYETAFKICLVKWLMVGSFNLPCRFTKRSRFSPFTNSITKLTGSK